MTEQQAKEAMLEWWQTQWELLHPGSAAPANIALALCVPWTSRNEVFSVEQLGPLGQWARVTMQHTTSRQTTQGQPGARKFERLGYLYVQLFGPIDAGSDGLSMLIGDARSVFEGKTIASGFTVFAGSTRELDDGSAPSFAGTSLVLPFRYTETR